MRKQYKSATNSLKDNIINIGRNEVVINANPKTPLFIINGRFANNEKSLIQVINNKNEKVLDILGDGTILTLKPFHKYIKGNIKINITQPNQGIFFNDKLHLSQSHLTLLPQNNNACNGLYLGNPTINGCWKFTTDINNRLLIQQRINEEWITKSMIQ